MRNIQKIIFRSSIIALAASALGIIFNFFNPMGIEINPKPLQKQQYVNIHPIVKQKKEAIGFSQKVVKPQTSASTFKVDLSIENIDLAKAKELFDKKEAIFLDTRPEFRYLEGHIKGSLSLSASMFPKQYEEVKDKIKKNSIIITYCSGVDCNLSDIVANKLKGLGYTNIKIFKGGWPLWNETGYAVETGKNY